MSRIRVLSYNVRYDNRNDHHDAWYARRDGVLGLVRFHRPDVVAFQEPLPAQRADLREGLPEYTFVGRGREPGGDGEGCPIGVRTDRWRVVDDGTFWLSETPNDPSTDWDAAHPRIATWAMVEPRESPDGPAARGTEPLLIGNTHFDHVSSRARRESARLLAERIPQLAAGGGDPGDASRDVVLVGDLNTTPGSEPHRILTGAVPDTDSAERRADLRDAVADAEIRHGPTTSVTDFVRLIDDRRIDHVLVSPGIESEAAATLADRDDRGRYPSDHLPVLVRLRRHSGASGSAALSGSGPSSTASESDSSSSE